MMHEYDKIEIPEKYRKMSVSELAKEKERIYQTLTIQNATDARKKALQAQLYFMCNIFTWFIMSECYQKKY